MTPLLLVVGFLGAGKTTFLKQLVEVLASRGLRPALLLNDYQNARIDAEQFRDLIEEVRALSGDCVCCGSREQFFDELRSFRHEPGRVLLIEANGATEPGPLIEALGLDRSIGGFRPPVQLTVVDVQRWQKRFWHNSLEREQARMATFLFLSRAALVPPDRLAEVRDSLAHIAPRGIETDPERLAAELEVSPGETSGPSASPSHCCGHHHHHEGPCGEPSNNDCPAAHFASCELPLPDLLDEKAFRTFLRELPAAVLRAKGIVRFAGRPDEFFVVQKIEKDLQFIPVGPSPRLAEPLLLCIGPGLNPNELKRRVEALASAAAGI